MRAREWQKWLLPNALKSAAWLSDAVLPRQGTLRLNVIRYGSRVARPIRRGNLERYFAYPLAKRTKGCFVAPMKNGLVMELEPTDLVQGVILVSGSWEPNVTAVMEALLRPGDTFADVGANVGYYTLLAAPLVGDAGTVYAFEASASTYKHLCQNLLRNRLDRVGAVNVAVGRVRGTATVHVAPAENIGETRVALTESEHRPPETWLVEPDVVSVEPLTHLLRDADPQHPMVVKIDVEGVERSVLEGFEALIASAFPDVALFLECSPAIGDMRADWLTAFAEGYGFEVFRLRNEYWIGGYFPYEVEPPVPLPNVPDGEQLDLLLVRGTILRGRLDQYLDRASGV
jgi:FkbM family methyltransferase